MPILSVLLRLLLCLGLVANGAGFAQASTHMQLGQGAMVEVPVTAADAGRDGAARGCHDAPPSAQLATEAAGSAQATDTGRMDCCDGDACPCSCTFQAPVAHATAAVPQGAALRFEAAFHDPARHRPPRLPHLIRPPIG